MNCDNAFDMIGEARERYVMDAIRSRKIKPNKTRVSKTRFLLIAAIISVALLLVSCAVAYFWLQDRSIGQESYTQKFDSQGHYIDPVEKTKDVVSFYGTNGSIMQQAQAEWSAFLKDYPSFFDLGITEEEAAEVPEPYYYPYDCYTIEMVEELDRITEKYGLKLVETDLTIQRYQYETAMAELGLPSVLRPDAKIKINDAVGSVMPPRNFSLELGMELDGAEASWAKSFSVYYHYADATFFAPRGTDVFDLAEFQQWKYTTSDGLELMLALDHIGTGLVVAERENDTIFLWVYGRPVSGTNFPKPEDVMDRKSLELIADSFDYTLIPKQVDAAALQAKLDKDEAAYRQKLKANAASWSGFTDFMKENGFQLTKLDYAFADLDGDGEEEMIIGSYAVAPIFRILDLHDGVSEMPILGQIHLLENGGLMIEYPGDNVYSSEGLQLNFYKPLESGYPISFAYDENSLGANTKLGEVEMQICKQDGAWMRYNPASLSYDVPITDEEVQTIISGHPEKTLNWMPVLEYPIDATGKTLGEELLERPVPKIFEEGLAFYGSYIYTGRTQIPEEAKFFCFKDIDSNGALDLILSEDGDTISRIYISQYGVVTYFGGNIPHLCPNNVIMYYDFGSAPDGADVEMFRFQKLNCTPWTFVAAVSQNLASGQWQDGITGDPISADDAQAVLDKYAPLKLDMHPIEELFPQ